jgi:hypothetical protein
MSVPSLRRFGPPPLNVDVELGPGEPLCFTVPAAEVRDRLGDDGPARIATVYAVTDLDGFGVFHESDDKPLRPAAELIAFG